MHRSGTCRQLGKQLETPDRCAGGNKVLGDGPHPGERELQLQRIQR
ncbi:hypothetical protein NST28_31735 [Paenibacillus sp. FSL R10-2791]